MRLSVSFKPRKGFANTIKHLDKIDGAFAEWGIYAEDGMHPTAEMLYSQLMAIHELRDDKWKRPIFYISATNKRFVAQYKKLIKEDFTKFVTNAAMGRYVHKEVALKRVAMQGAENAKSVFGNNRMLVKNSARTIALKGHNKPMIDLGALKSKVRFKVKRKEASNAN